jgi:hypothetical protein
MLDHSLPLRRWAITRGACRSRNQSKNIGGDKGDAREVSQEEMRGQRNGEEVPAEFEDEVRAHGLERESKFLKQTPAPDCTAS